jgi:hypothetical protein
MPGPANASSPVKASKTKKKTGITKRTKNNRVDYSKLRRAATENRKKYGKSKNTNDRVIREW